MTSRQLDHQRILLTLEQLGQRIEERFPGAGLGRVSRDLLALARQCSAEAEKLGRPVVAIRVAVGFLALLMVVASVGVFLAAWQRGVPGFSSLGEYVQAVEAVVNDVVFLGVAIFFLFTLEARHKRRRALRAIHELRSVAHIVDMHQLTKDPEQLASVEPDTASSPTRQMTPAQLGRYLDYCSELLSLTSKIAALYVQHFDDAVTLAAVNEIESLTTGFSRKIWQKIAILQRDTIVLRA